MFAICAGALGLRKKLWAWPNECIMRTVFHKQMDNTHQQLTGWQKERQEPLLDQIATLCGTEMRDGARPTSIDNEQTQHESQAPFVSAGQPFVAQTATTYAKNSK